MYVLCCLVFLVSFEFVAVLFWSFETYALIFEVSECSLWYLSP